MKAVVTGISGQDGYYMAQLLRERNIEVVGLTSNLERARREYAVPDAPEVQLVPFDFAQIGGFETVVREFAPDLIFNFAAKATGQGMFDTPFEMNRLNGTLVLDILEAIRNSPRRDQIAFCQASSSEIYGNVVRAPQDEETPFRPMSPYGAAKLYAHNLVNIYRATYGLRCCSAILYNHESVRRSAQFVTKKIAGAAAAIKLGLVDELSLGYLGTSRDWGYAPEYVQAMFQMATAPVAADYVVATGRLNTIQRLLEIAFGHVGLDYEDYVLASSQGRRIVESTNLCGDPRKIARELNWRAQKPIKQIMTEMVEYELDRLKRGGAP